MRSVHDCPLCGYAGRWAMPEVNMGRCVRCQLVYDLETPSGAEIDAHMSAL